jgi:hypothetical protein
MDGCGALCTADYPGSNNRVPFGQVASTRHERLHGISDTMTSLWIELKDLNSLAPQESPAAFQRA